MYNQLSMTDWQIHSRDTAASENRSALSTDLLFLEDRDQTEDSGGELLAVQGGCHHVPGDASVVNDDDPI